MSAQVISSRMSNGAQAVAQSVQPAQSAQSAQSAPGKSRLSTPTVTQQSGSSVAASMALPLSARKSAGLDVATVARRGSTKPPSSEQEAVGSACASPAKTRLHAIPNAPVFRPTAEEFEAGPIAYMQKIRLEGEKYGIVKIIPPPDWNPPFSIDSEKFHFRTRKQELNQTDGGTRANLNYLDNLAKFHKQRNGTHLNRFPSVDKRPLDLYKLKKFVEDKGGFDSVCRGKRWAEIGRDLGYSGKIMSSLSTSLKNSYQKWLQPYEDWLKENKPAVLQAQQERDNVTSYTPSPGPAAHNSSLRNLPAAHADSLTKASKVLQAKLGSDAAKTPPGGFTAVNAKSAPSASVSANPVTPTSPVGFAAINLPSHDARRTSPASSDTPTNPREASDPSTPSMMNGSANHLKRPPSPDCDSLDDADPDGRRSKRCRNRELTAPTVLGSQMMQPRLPVSKPISARDRTNDKPGDCDICGRDEAAGPALVCDSCDATYHKSCCDQPPNTAAPEGDWHCQRCLVGTQEFGFEEGGIYSLKQFQEKARDFKNRHFAKSFPIDPLTGDVDVPEEEVEREFWRLTESLTETVVVEYGADIHSTTHGSGFPTMERQPFSVYSSSPWNLNVMPLAPDSLFRYIKSDISGMTVPWDYVGMCFSTFCWHNEDHYSYSANYQHFGATKTWYGIPSSSSHRFEAAMRQAVPELFEQQPDLLFQLVTLLQPEKLKKAGVDVYALDQHPGEFVITFPQAYHAGFNHGFNFNEAVNFSPSDWEPFGSKAVASLQLFKRQPIFSHDELLFSAAEPLLSPSTKDHCIKTAKWLFPALERVINLEFVRREHYAAALLDLADESDANGSDPDLALKPDIFPHIVSDASLPDEETVCAYCKSYGYLSRYQCKTSSRVLCLQHAGGYECCDATAKERWSCSDGNHEIQLRYKSDKLLELTNKILEISEMPEKWIERLDDELDKPTTPSLKMLRAMVVEGEKIDLSWTLPRLLDLRNFVQRCTQWIEEASQYIVRKPAGRRKTETRSRGSLSEETKKRQDREEAKKDVLHNPDSIKRLLSKARDLDFDCPELEKLQARYDRIEAFRKRVNDFERSIDIIDNNDLAELIEEGKDIDMDLPEIKKLENRANKVEWFAKAHEYSNQMEHRNAPSLDELSTFIEQGKKLDISHEDQYMRFFMEKQTSGRFWEKHAQEVMNAEVVNYHQLDGVYKQAKVLPVARATLARIEELLKKQREAEERLRTLVERTRCHDLRERPTYKEVREVMDSMGYMNSKPPGAMDLEREQKRHEDWMRRGKKLFGKANAPLHILHQHMQIVLERNQACLDTHDHPRMPVEPASREVTPDEPDVEEPHPSRDVFCICRRPESGMMIECELCHEWYHGRCLKIARGKVKEDDKYTCPICDYRVKIPRDAARPKLEELERWQDEIADLPFQPEEEQTLRRVIETAENFRNHISYLINPISTSPDDLSVQRFYLRKIEGADVLLAHETNFLRQEVHKWAPVASEPPKLIEVSLSTRKPRPTKAQKLMTRLGVNSIDELPEHLRPKAPKNRRHPHPDGHRSGKGSIPANPSSNAKPGESIIGRPVYPDLKTPSRHAHGRDKSMSRSGTGSTPGASRAPSNPPEGTPAFVYGPEMAASTINTNSYAPQSPLFGPLALHDPYMSPNVENTSGNVYGATVSGTQSIDPQLENMFAHPSGLHPGSPEPEDLNMNTNPIRHSLDLTATSEAMDTLFNTLTENQDDFEFVAVTSYPDNDMSADDGDRYQ